MRNASPLRPVSGRNDGKDDDRRDFSGTEAAGDAVADAPGGKRPDSVAARAAVLAGDISKKASGRGKQQFGKRGNRKQGPADRKRKPSRVVTAGCIQRRPGCSGQPPHCRSTKAIRSMTRGIPRSVDSVTRAGLAAETAILPHHVRFFEKFFMRT